MTCLIVGATGALGRPLTQRLHARGIAVRAACRHPQQAADLAALGAEPVAVDLIDRASLEHACQGVQRVILAAHAILGRGRWRSEAVDDAGARALIDIARAAGVDRFVYCSAFSARVDHPVDFFATKARIEQVLRASGMPFAILRPTAFMEHHVHAFNGAAVLAGGKARLIGPATKPRNFVAATDVARIAERALLDEPLPFQTLDIGGPDHLSNLDVARLYAREAGITLRESHLPRGAARMIARVAAPFHPGLARILQLQSADDNTLDERFDGAAALEARFGFALTRVADFVRARVPQVQQHRAGSA